MCCYAVYRNASGFLFTEVCFVRCRDCGTGVSVDDGTRLLPILGPPVLCADVPTTVGVMQLHITQMLGPVTVGLRSSAADVLCRCDGASALPLDARAVLCRWHVVLL